MTFGEKLRHARLALNLSQLELSEKVGVNERSIYTYEQAGVFPRERVLQKLADTLHVSVDYLRDDDENTAMKHVDEELFLANVKFGFGYKGAKEAQEVLDKASALFAGGELSDDAKTVFLQSLMEVFLESKAEASAKFTPKRKKRRNAQ